ncbi:MAG TPA: hypothetical protein VIX63_15025 [Vicinamibacterales bacterium]
MRLSTITGVMLAVGLLAACGVQAQSLGDVAQQEESRRKGVKAPGKVYTNESLKTVEPPAPPATPSSPAPQAAAPAEPATPAAPNAAAPAAPATPAAPNASASPAPPGVATPGAATEGPRDEKYWRGKLESARTALSRAYLFQEALQSRINALSTDFVNRDDPAQRSVIAAERQKALAELDRVKQEIAQNQKAIVAIQEEGRRAGVPAGWLR